MIRHQHVLKVELDKRYRGIGQRAPIHPFLSRKEVELHFERDTKAFEAGMAQAEACQRFTQSGWMMIGGVLVLILLSF